MKKILLLSDTHGYLDDTILKRANEVDEIWHAGDIGNLRVTDQLAKIKPIRAVYGNIDDAKTRLQFPEHNEFEIEGVKVFITHIGGYPGRYNPKIRPLLEKSKADLFICGHSHILKVMRDKRLDLLHMNPGAIGIHGFHKVRTMLSFEVNKGSIENLIVLEYPR
ncbi:metallophosphoesterase family protein [Aegicerativicinus sediminis]|uniref:metallophosphoesterase family protein n=1 Tax=Aegicerativicinus sediminis TaxID=2893202 RepID=UPI001E5CC154|nr:metallophosphoesterase family protein [Aegicerativicinus sediminis]